MVIQTPVGYKMMKNQQKLADATIEIKMKIELLLQHFVKHFHLNQTEWKYVEISDCEYNHKIPKYKDKEGTSKYSNKDFLFPFKNVYTYKGFLENILTKKTHRTDSRERFRNKKRKPKSLFWFYHSKSSI